MENVNDKQLSFPQRNWFLICIIVAIVSPLVVHLIETGAHKEAYREAVETRPIGSGSAGADSAQSKDTAYKMNNPPGNGAASKNAAGGSAAGSGAGGSAAGGDSAGGGSGKGGKRGQ